MSDKFQNKYRIPSARLVHWDYGNEASYFITICTRNRRHFFGEVVEKEMILNQLGKKVEEEWLKTFIIRKDMNLVKGEFVVMPNHFHAIIGIDSNTFNQRDETLTYSHVIHKSEPSFKNKFGPQSKNLSSILRGFKSAVTVYAKKKENNDFQWQARFHDHVIKDSLSYFKIRNYIKANPSKWQEDRYF